MMAETIESSSTWSSQTPRPSILARETSMPEDNSSLSVSATTGMSVDFWKLLRVAERIMLSLPEDKQKRVSAQLRFSANRLESHLSELNISLPTFEGQVFGPELPAMAVNADEFEDVECLIVESAVEPAVILNGQVIETAKVMLKEVAQDVSRN